jgi:hypothetical protein
MKQTAVEWLIEQLENSNVISKYAFPEMIEQAKAMEKEQIIQAASWTPEDGLSVLSELAEQYYNETFKSE